MKLTPLDIRKHQFAKRLRGYDPEEVRPFLEMLSGQWEELRDELRHAQDRVRELEGKLQHYERVEMALQEALEGARANAQRSQEHAEERARLIVEEAELKAEQLRHEAEQERFRLRQDVSKLTHRHAEVTARLRHFLMSEMEILAQHEEERPIGFLKLIPSREEAQPLPPAPEAETVELAASPDPSATEPDTPAPEATAEDEAARAKPASERASEGEPEGTTYGDLYARAARRAREAEPPASGEEDPMEEPEEEPAWTLRSLVADAAGETDDEPLGSGGEPVSEKERIRRILEDLD